MDITYRVLTEFPEPDYTALVNEAFSDYEESELLAEVARQEIDAGTGTPDQTNEGALRIGAFSGEKLVGWTYARPEGTSLLYMINSGVATAERQNGIYSELARMVIEHAKREGYVAILSRHAASNNPMIIAKLKLGFTLSGFEYSEVYGPLVRLTYILGSLRRELYQSRSRPIRRARPKNDA